MRITTKNPSMWALVAAAWITAAIVWTGRPEAAVVFEFTGECVDDCTPGGMISGTVTAVTGSLTLDIPNTPGLAQPWAAADGVAFSFDFNGLVLTESTFAVLQTFNFPAALGDDPFSPAFATLDADNGPTVAPYDSSSNLRLFGMGELHQILLFQRMQDVGSASCDAGVPISFIPGCQTTVDGVWNRVAAVPQPHALILVGAALLAGAFGRSWRRGAGGAE